MNNGWNVSREDVRAFINEEDMVEVLVDLINGDCTIETIRQDFDRWELTLIKEEGTQQ